MVPSNGYTSLWEQMVDGGGNSSLPDHECRRPTMLRSRTELVDQLRDMRKRWKDEVIAGLLSEHQQCAVVGADCR